MDQRKEAKKARARKYYHDHKEECSIRHKQWRQNNPVRRRHIERVYKSRKAGTALPEYPTRVMPEFCEMPECDKKACVADHDHKTGKFRGWLCQGCNSGLGKLGDNIHGLMIAISYLEKILQT